jgi:three-Cys-motif partner protein
MNIYLPRSYLQTLWPWTKSVERILRHTQPRPFSGSHLAVGSDYSGNHKGSSFNTYCYLIMDTDRSPAWPRLRGEVRRQFLPNGRRMSFKNLGDGHRQRALIPFLQSADSISGHLVALVVTKQLSNLSWRYAYDDTVPKQLGLRGTWKARPFEAMFRSAHMFALMLSIGAESSRRRATFRPYVFVEKSRRKAAQLERLKADFPQLSDRIKIERADANSAIQAFCKTTDWRRTRAVLFLDPFGNQVGWSTLEVIARTRAIDVWYLFPAHLGINRQISSTAEFDAAKAASLDWVFGTDEWRAEFLTTTKASDLWGDEQERLIKQATVDSITRYMIKRMKQVFKGVVLDEWLPLGRGGSHWYSLLFACSNPSAPATRIAERVARAVMNRK